MDIFKTLSVGGAKFDKKRFQNDLNLFNEKASKKQKNSNSDSEEDGSDSESSQKKSASIPKSLDFFSTNSSSKAQGDKVDGKGRGKGKEKEKDSEDRKRKRENGEWMDSILLSGNRKLFRRMKYGTVDYLSGSLLFFQLQFELVTQICPSHPSLSLSQILSLL